MLTQVFEVIKNPTRWVTAMGWLELLWSLEYFVPTWFKELAWSAWLQLLCCLLPQSSANKEHPAWTSAVGFSLREYLEMSMFVFAQMFSHVWLFATPCTIAHRTPLSMRSSRQEHWSGLPFPTPGDLPDPGIKLVSSASPALAGRFFTTSVIWEALGCLRQEKREEWLQPRREGSFKSYHKRARMYLSPYHEKISESIFICM